MKKILLLLSVFAAWAGCRKDAGRESLPVPGNDALIVSSNNIVPEMVYMDLGLSYDGLRNQTTANATFIYRNPFDSLDGARVRLNSWGAILFNNMPLVEVNTDAYYSRTFNGFISEGDFVWNSWIALSYTNHVQLKPVTFPDLPYDLSANNYILPWVGDSVGVNETVSLVFGKLNKPFLFSTATPQDTAVSIDWNKIKKLFDKKDAGLMFFKRKCELPLQEGTVLGGRITTIYEGDSVGVKWGLKE